MDIAYRPYTTHTRAQNGRENKWYDVDDIKKKEKEKSYKNTLCNY